MNTTASTSTPSTAAQANTLGLSESLELPEPASAAPLEAGLGWLLRQVRRSTGLTDAGLFWVGYLCLIGLVVFAARG